MSKAHSIGKVVALQGFLTIVMGIALTNIVEQFLVQHRMYVALGINGSGGNAGPEFPGAEEVILLFAVVFLLVRFYHGNMYSLNDIAAKLDSGQVSKRNLATSWLVVVFQGLVFSAIGFFCKNTEFLCLGILTLFGVDFAWGVIWVIAEINSHRRTPVAGLFSNHPEGYLFKWAGINLAGGLALYIGLTFAKAYLPWVVSVIIFVTSLADYWVNRDFYFQADGTTLAS